MMISILTLLLCLLSLKDFQVQGDTQTNCNLFSGTWVHDPSYPLYDALNCPYIIRQFNCRANGRPDSDYQEWRWQPNGCDIPSFNVRRLLEKVRGKKIMFVGDSLSQNQFLSLICLISKDFPTAFVPSSNKNDKFISTEYDVSVELFWAPYLVDLEINNEGKRILHVDEIQENSAHWVADVLIFESSKWWPQTLGSQRWDIVIEGNESYANMYPLVAYRKALTTWSQWVSSNVTTQTLVFFRSTSFSHYNWRKRCSSEEKPIEDPSYDPQPTPHAFILQEVLSSINFPVKLLNISHNSAFRKDGHPSMYSNRNISVNGRQDCLHWCLPGVPDSWNELFYATLLGT